MKILNSEEIKQINGGWKPGYLLKKLITELFQGQYACIQAIEADVQYNPYPYYII